MGSCGRLFLIVMLWVCVAVAAPDPVPDVFLITIDTLRADHVGCYGARNAETSALDSLARDGVRFSQAFTPSPITNSSHASILTGVYPRVHGVTDFGFRVSSSNPLWAELLKQNGYRTAAFIGAVILDSATLAPGLDRGFDYFDHFPAKSSDEDKKRRWNYVERRGVDVVGHAEAWLAKHLRGPRFLWVHLYDPHDPYEPPGPFAEKFKDHPYDGEIAYADSALGGLLAFLKQRGLYDRSLIVVVGDHGEGLGEHKEETHGIFLYDSTLHVPMIVKLPSAAHKGRVVDQQVRTIDLLPTVLESLGVQSDAQFDGRSLVQLFSEASPESNGLLAETDYPLRFGWAPLRAVRKDGWKFIEAPRPELYNLSSDVGEASNQYDPANALVGDFRGLLSAARTKETSSPSPAGSLQTGPELKALGDEEAVSPPKNVRNLSALPDPKDKIEIQNFLHKGMMAAESGQTEAASVALHKAVELDPTSATVLSQLGQVELQAGNYADAAAHLRRAYQIRPEDTAAAFYFAQAASQLGDWPGVRETLEASLKLTPGQLEARQLLGEAYLHLHDLVAAQDQFEAAIFLDPKNPAPRRLLARCLMTSKKYRDAVEQIGVIVGQGAASAEDFRLLAEAYTALGEPIKARQAAARASPKSAKPR